MIPAGYVHSPTAILHNYRFYNHKYQSDKRIKREAGGQAVNTLAYVFGGQLKKRCILNAQAVIMMWNVIFTRKKFSALNMLLQFARASAAFDGQIKTGWADNSL